VKLARIGLGRKRRGKDKEEGIDEEMMMIKR